MRLSEHEINRRLDLMPVKSEFADTFKTLLGYVFKSKK